MKTSLEIQINPYTTLDFISETNCLVPDNGHEAVFNVRNGASIDMIKAGMECTIEFPGGRLVQGKIKGVQPLDGMSNITVCHGKERP